MICNIIHRSIIFSLVKTMKFQLLSRQLHKINIIYIILSQYKKESFNKNKYYNYINNKKKNLIFYRLIKKKNKINKKTLSYVKILIILRKWGKFQLINNAKIIIITLHVNKLGKIIKKIINLLIKKIIEV